MSDNAVDRLLELERTILRDIRDVNDLRQEARTLEWQASPRSIAEGRKGGKPLHQDPTALIATDEHRLAVRNALSNAEEDLMRAHHHVLAAKARLTKAVEGWRG